MPTAVFRGAISFGLVSVPVRLFTATDEKQFSLHMVHRKDQARVRFKRVCERDGEELRAEDIARAFEAPDGRMAVLSTEDMKHLPLPGKHTVEVLSFTGLEQIDPVRLGRSYLVEADPKSPGKPYVLLRDALAESGQVGIVRLALRGREHLAVLRAAGELLVVQLLMWPDEIRDPSQVQVPDESVRAQEKKMAMGLISSMTEDFDPDRYEDHYKEALAELVEAKLEGAELPEEEAPSGGGGQVLDLMAALRASVDDAKGTRKRARKAPAKKTAAKKTAAKKAAGKASADKSGSGGSGGSGSGKAAAKKTAAKKTAAKKTASGRTGAAAKPAKKSAAS